MEQCIALNSLKYCFNKNENIATIAKTIIKSQDKPMCLVWLANLYLTDSKFRDINISLNSNLSKTPWGIFDVYTRFKPHYNNKEKLTKIINSHLTDKTLLRYINLENGDSDINFDNLKKTKLYLFINNAKNRGRFGVNLTDKKWLFSILYGSWRDQIQKDLKDYLQNTPQATIEQELNLSQHFFQIETKMFILSYFEYDSKNFELYKDALRWSLSDNHPWVNNIAVRLFKEFDTVKMQTIDNKLYPGLLDLLLTAKKAECNIDNHIQMLTSSEKNAICTEN